MKDQPQTSPATQHESVDIVDIIRRLRNELVKDFLDERVMQEYLSTQYKINELSRVKVEFIKGDLQRLLISPVNMEWYKPIMDEYTASGSAALTEGNERLFYKEIEGILKKYMY